MENIRNSRCVEIPHTMFTWIPIDHDPVSDTLIKCVRIIPNLVSMSDLVKTVNESWS